MKATTMVALAVLATLAIVAVLPTGNGPGAGWADTGPQGHSQLARSLAQRHDVRAIEGSISLLPEGAGDGDTLFLFPSYRPPGPGELDRLQSFAARGGRVVMAADGASAATWGLALGVPAPSGLPLVRAPGPEGTCLELRLPSLPDRPACLPSPTSFPSPGTLPGQEVRAGQAQAPVFLDLDGDGTLSIGDQGPLNLTIGLEQGAASAIVAIGDADLWRNEALAEHPHNLELALGLVSGRTGRVFLDSTASVDEPWAQATSVRALASPTFWQAAGLALICLVAAMAPLATAKALPWSAHRHDPAKEDEALEHRAAQALATSSPALIHPNDSRSSGD